MLPTSGDLLLAVRGCGCVGEVADIFDVVCLLRSVIVFIVFARPLSVDALRRGFVFGVDDTGWFWTTMMMILVLALAWRLQC